MRAQVSGHVRVWYATSSGMRKVPFQLRRGVSGELAGGNGLLLPLSLVTGKEEKLVTAIELGKNYWAPCGCAELMPLENVAGTGIFVIEIAVGIKGVIPDVIISSHVNNICSRLGYDADNSSAIARQVLHRVAGKGGSDGRTDGFHSGGVGFYHDCLSRRANC